LKAERPDTTFLLSSGDILYRDALDVFGTRSVKSMGSDE